jgi:hypothetical protein
MSNSFPCRERPHGCPNRVTERGEACFQCQLPDGFRSRAAFIAWLEARLQAVEEQLAAANLEELRVRRAALCALLNAQRRLRR